MTEEGIVSGRAEPEDDRLERQTELCHRYGCGHAAASKILDLEADNERLKDLADAAPEMEAENKKLRIQMEALHEAIDGIQYTTLAADLARIQAERAALAAERDALHEALEKLLRSVQDEHEAEGAEDEGFILALHVPWGDLLRARVLLSPATKPYTIADSNRDQSEETR